MRITIAEGTVEEISDFYRQFKGNDLQVVATELKDEASSENSIGENGFPIPTLEEALAVLSRIPLKPKILVVLRALRDASPNWVGAAELRALVDYTPSQFAGLMGAFGRRVTHTKNMRESVSFFDATWDHVAGEWSYLLPTAVMEAMKKLKL